MKKLILIFAVFVFSGNVLQAQNRKKVLAFVMVNKMSNQIGRKILRMTNRFRSNQGLNKLKWNQDIANIARKHARQMANNKVGFNHDKLNQRIASFARKPKSAGENLYKGNYSDVARTAVQGWKKSPGHRKNLLGRFNEMGVGAKMDAKGIWYVNQLFALY